MNSDKPFKHLATKLALQPYEPSGFAFLKKELNTPEILFYTVAHSFSFPLEKRAFEDYIKQENCTPYLLKLDTEIVAYGDLICVPGVEQRLCRLVVGKAYRGKGYGKQLVQALVKEAQETENELPITLFVMESNLPAKNCYISCGFEATGKQTMLDDGKTEHPTIQMKYHGPRD